MPVTNGLDSHAAPYWRLSSFYFFYFATLGALLPFWSLYLKHLGFSPPAIGGLMGLIAATKILAPYIWGWIADHTGRRLTMIRAASLVSVVCFAGVFFSSDFIWLASVMFLFSFFWNAGLPQFEVTTLRFLGDDHHRYSDIRLWGSIGFIVTVISLGPVLDRFGIAYLPYVLLGLYFCIWISTLCVPNSPQLERHTISGTSVLAILKQPIVAVTLLAGFLMQFGFGPYYTFFSIHLENHAYSKAAVGIIWSLGVVAEVFIFLMMYRLLPAVGPKRLLLLCFLCAAVRWTVTGLLADYIFILIITQLLHAITFGVFHAVMVHLIHRFFSGAHQGRGQALYSSLSFGAGGALGAYLSGYSWDAWGADATFLIAGASAVLGIVLILFGMPKINDSDCVTGKVL